MYLLGNSISCFESPACHCYPIPPPVWLLLFQIQFKLPDLGWRRVWRLTVECRKLHRCKLQEFTYLGKFLCWWTANNICNDLSLVIPHSKNNIREIKKLTMSWILNSLNWHICLHFYLFSHNQYSAPLGFNVWHKIKNYHVKITNLCAVTAFWMIFGICLQVFLHFQDS